MAPQPKQPERLVALAIAAAAPGLAVLAGLAAFGKLSAASAMGGGVSLLLGCLVLVRPFLSSVRAVRGYAEALGAGREVEPPTGATLLVPELVTAVRRSHEIMQRQRTEAERDRALQARVLDGLPDPVLIADADQRVLHANRAAQDLLAQGLVGRDLTAVIRNPEFRRALDRVAGGSTGSIVAEFTMPVPAERVVEANIFPVGQGGQRPAGRDEPRGVATIAVVLHDITESKRVDQVRSDFIANLGHEMRTPLTNIIGFIDTLRGPAAEDPEARERFLSVMARQSGRMHRLLKDLTSLSAIEQEEHSLPNRTVELTELVRSVADEFEAAAEAAEVTLNVAIDEDLDGNAFVRGDADQLAEVLTNLIDNAIKYGPSGTLIDVQVTSRRRGNDDRPSIFEACVADNGPGIATEHLPRLTERFYRVDSARGAGTDSTGLGLAIVKHIMTRHRGRLTVDSSPGEGSRFCVELPAAVIIGESSDSADRTPAN